MIFKYNYSHIIKKEHQKKAIKLVDEIIKSGNWYKSKEIPKFQTHSNLYKYEEFKIFTETFLNSCFQYLNFTPKYKIEIWVFRDNIFNNLKKDQSIQWHEHSGGNINKISGIYYLRNFRNEGTEFLSFKIDPEPYTWYIYPAHLLHKPPKIKSFRNRYVIAADFEYN